MFSVLITSQIINLRIIGEVFGLEKCYQSACETLGPRARASGKLEHL